MGVRVAVISHAAVLAVNAEPFAALSYHGAEVTLIAPAALRTDLRGDLTFEALPGFPGRIVSLPVSIGGYRKWMGGQRGIHAIVYRGLSQKLDEIRPQVVFVEEEPYSFAAGQAARWCRSRRVPFVVHQNQNLSRKLPLPFERIRAFVLSRASGCTVRNLDAAEVLRNLGFDGPIEWFPHGVDPSRFQGSPKTTTLAHPVVGFVGRLVDEKGILDLIDAMITLRKSAPAGAASARSGLLVVGDGPLMHEARTRVQNGDLPAHFTGAVAHEEVPSWYPAMDLVVVPSRATPTWTEQFGRVPVEANAAGVPVLVSDSGELARTVEATSGGLVYEPGLLASQLQKLLDDADLRGRLGASGLAGVRENFTQDAVAKRLMSILEVVRPVRF